VGYKGVGRDKGLICVNEKQETWKMEKTSKDACKHRGNDKKTLVGPHLAIGTLKEGTQEAL
jgi:hypothetical protein